MRRTNSHPSAYWLGLPVVLLIPGIAHATGSAREFLTAGSLYLAILSLALTFILSIVMSFVQHDWRIFVVQGLIVPIILILIMKFWTNAGESRATVMRKVFRSGLDRDWLTIPVFLLPFIQLLYVIVSFFRRR